MPLFDDLFDRHGDKTLLAVLVLVSLALLSSPASFKLGFATAVVTRVAEPWARARHYLEEVGKLRAENRELKELAARLMLEREKLLQYRQEREKLRRMASFREEQFFRLLPCEVIDRWSDRFQTSLLIDRGKDDSVRVGMPVLSYQGLVGRVRQVNGNSSWVHLIAGKGGGAVSCLDKRSRVVGILEWTEGNHFRWSYVEVEADVRPGDTLITSGYGRTVPKGIPVAEVINVKKAPDGVTLLVKAQGLVPLDTLEEVFVLIGWVPWEEALGEDAVQARRLLGRGGKR